MIKPFIIGISGGTASGKTTLANQLVEHFGKKASFISLDFYYKDYVCENLVDYAKINFDSPESIDIDMFASHLHDIKTGKDSCLPQYDFVTHRRNKETFFLRVTPIIVVEGLFLFNAVPDSQALFDLKIYTEAPDDIRFIRRLQRDIAERGRNVETVVSRYLSTVRPMHQKYVLPNKELSDVVFNGSKDFKMAYHSLLKVLNSKLTIE